MKLDGRRLIACGMIATALAGCTMKPQPAGSPGVNASDPDARSFVGTIISLRPTISTMMISKEEHHGDDAFPNQIVVKYDAQTAFLLDGKTATLDQVRQYMTVKIDGHMRGGQLFAETANFSSVLPKNVKPAP